MNHESSQTNPQKVCPDTKTPAAESENAAEREHAWWESVKYSDQPKESDR